MPARPPLIDLHRHLDGSIRLATILDLGRQHGIPLPGDTLEELKPHVVVKSGADLTAAAAIHHRIHEVCFIARSVNFPVDYAPTFEVAG